MSIIITSAALVCAGLTLLSQQVDSGQDTKELQHRLERMHRQVEELQGMLDDQREEASLQTQQLREELRKVHDQHNSRVLQLELQYKVRRGGAGGA